MDAAVHELSLETRDLRNFRTGGKLSSDGSLGLRLGRRQRKQKTMTPQDVVGLAPSRGLLALIAMILTSMAACFWTSEAEAQPEALRRD